MEFFDFTNVAQTIAATLTNDPYYTYYWVCLIVGAVAFLAIYVIQAISLYSIATVNGYKSKWMAFVPFINTYYIGVLAEKNKTFNKPTKYFSLAMAIVEFICLTLGIVYSVAILLLFNGNYVNAISEPFIYNTAGEVIATVFTGKYELVNLPAELAWTWWVFNNLGNYILNPLQLVYLVLSVFVLSAFFRTYSPRNYMVFTIFSVILPIKAIFMICIRNNKATGYMDYVRERQKRQYDAYQAYMRNMNNGNYNGGNNNGAYNNNGGYNGGGSAPEDPFGGLGEQHGNSSAPSDDDPFGDLK